MISQSKSVLKSLEEVDGLLAVLVVSAAFGVEFAEGIEEGGAGEGGEAGVCGGDLGGGLEVSLGVPVAFEEEALATEYVQPYLQYPRLSFSTSRSRTCFRSSSQRIGLPSKWREQY
jgi:hypothetical protein